MSSYTEKSPAFAANISGGYRRLTPNGRARDTAAVLSKLVPEVQSQRFGQNYTNANGRGQGNKTMQAPDMGLMQRISDMTANDVSDANTIFQILPETELAMQILVSSILAPKDLVTTSLTFSLEANRFNSELVGSMLEVVREHFEKIYKISDILTPMLQDMLFLTGSYPILILPESSIDLAINSPGRVSMESIADDINPHNGQLRNIGFLGKPRDADPSEDPFKIKLGLEHYGATPPDYDPKVMHPEWGDTLLSVVDNPNLIKMKRLQERVTKDRTYDLLERRNLTQRRVGGLQVSQEQYSQYTAYVAPKGRESNYRHEPVAIMPTAQNARRPTVGHPLAMKVPSEAVIPVHQPSNPEKHLGYFLVLDRNGNFINRANERDYYADMADSLNTSSSMASQMIAQTNRAFNGQATDRQSEIDEMSRIYGQFLEKELTDRLRAGVYGDDVSVAAPTEVYRVMMARAFAHRHTQLLYVPGELMSYFAFDYNKYGIGQSLLQASKILGGIRLVTLFANNMCNIKNSINRTQLNITLSPEDPNPTHTVEFMMTEFAKTRQHIFPLGAGNPSDVVTYLQRASIDVAVQGNTNYPEVRLDVQEKAGNRTAPNLDLEKDLRDRHLMAMGLSPDMVDAGANAEFATSVLANNLLLAKRVLNYQSRLEQMLGDFVVKYILADGEIMDELRKLVEANRDKLTAGQQRAQNLSNTAKQQRETLMTGNESLDERLEDLEEMGQDAVIMEFLQCIMLSLPKPDMSTLKSQMEAYEAREQAYEKALDAYINGAYLEANGLGGLVDLIEPTKGALKAELMRRWMRDNNVLPELNDLLVSGDDQDADKANIYKDIGEHVKSMSGSILRVMFSYAQVRKGNDPATQRLKTILEASGETFNSGGDTWGGGGDTPPADDGFGTDPGAGGDDLAMDDLGGDPAATGEEPAGGDMPEMPEVTL